MTACNSVYKIGANLANYHAYVVRTSGLGKSKPFLFCRIYFGKCGTRFSHFH